MKSLHTFWKVTNASFDSIIEELIVTDVGGVQTGIGTFFQHAKLAHVTLLVSSYITVAT